MNRKASNTKTDPRIEKQVVALIASGSKYADISEKTSVPVSTIKKIKRRNTEGLAQITKQIIQSQAQTAARLLQKSHRQIEKNLDRAFTGDVDIALKDLVSVSKEMFHQSQIEKGEPTAIVRDSPASREHAEAVRIAMESDDMVALVDLIFPKKSENDTQRLISSPL